MPSDFLGTLLLVLLFISPAFILPIFIGPAMLHSARDEFGRLAAWFTLKPLLATPLWFLASILLPASIENMLGPFYVVIPAIPLTALIVWRFRSLLKTEALVVVIFLLVDAMRWLNTVGYVWLGRAPNFRNPYYVAGMLLPNAYALLALGIVWLRAKRRKLVIS